MPRDVRTVGGGVARTSGPPMLPIRSIRRQCLAAVLLVGLSSRSAFALDPSKAISQYVHTSWGIKAGMAADGVTSIIQGRDGFMWVGTQKGL